MRLRFFTAVMALLTALTSLLVAAGTPAGAAVKAPAALADCGSSDTDPACADPVDLGVINPDTVSWTRYHDRGDGNYLFVDRNSCDATNCNVFFYQYEVTNQYEKWSPYRVGYVCAGQSSCGSVYWPFSNHSLDSYYYPEAVYRWRAAWNTGDCVRAINIVVTNGVTNGPVGLGKCTDTGVNFVWHLFGSYHKMVNPWVTNHVGTGGTSFDLEPGVNQSYVVTAYDSDTFQEIISP